MKLAEKRVNRLPFNSTKRWLVVLGFNATLTLYSIDTHFDASTTNSF